MRENQEQQFAVNTTRKIEGDEPADFDQAMLLTGYGRYNLTLLLVCGLMMMVYGCQFSFSAYILPSAQCDLNFSSTEMGFYNAAFLIGATTSSIISSAIADTFGRKKILIWCLLIDGCVTLLSSLSQTFVMLFTLRCINGFAVGGPSTIILLFFGEFHAKKLRTQAVLFLGFFWAFSVVLLPALAWIIIPLKFNIVVYGFVFNSWRLFICIFGWPSLFCAFLISKYPETPKFLHSQGRNIEALDIMREIFVSNTKQNIDEYPVENLISDYYTIYNKSNTLSTTLRRMWGQICCLFISPLRTYTFVTGFFLFANVFGYYGLGLWLPELFNRFEIYHELHPNETITVCELAYLRQEDYKTPNIDTEDMGLKNSNGSFSIKSNSTTDQFFADNTTVMCENSVNPQVFLNTIIIGFSSVLGSLASGYLANHWERKVMPVATMMISGTCGCMIYFLRTSMQNLIVNCVYFTSILMANMVIYSAIIDIFPTNVNAMAVGIASVFGRLGGILSNILFGLLIDISCEVPIFLVGSIVILGGLLGFLLPKNPLVLPEETRSRFLALKK